MTAPGTSTGARSTWQTDPATEKALRYLRDLAGKRALFGQDVTPTDALARIEAEVAAGMTGARASDLISQAQRAFPYPPEVVPARESSLRSLRWAATEKALFGLEIPKEETIARLGALIEAGMTQKDADDLYRQTWRAKPYPTAKSPLPLRLIEGIEDLAISEGHYAVLIDGVLRFYRVYSPTSGEYKNVPSMRRFAGDNLLALYPGEAKAALTLIDADPDTAAFRFSDEFTLCWVCGKQLTDPVSRLISVGPTCRGFGGHGGLKAAAAEVDADPTRRHVYRALREWALAQGFSDPRSKDDRQKMAGQVTASRLASAWSGLPGVLSLGTPEQVVAQIKDSLINEVADPIRDALTAAPADTIGILLDSGVLTGPVMQILTKHPNEKVKQAAKLFFLTLLGG